MYINIDKTSVTTKLSKIGTHSSRHKVSSECGQGGGVPLPKWKENGNKNMLR